MDLLPARLLQSSKSGNRPNECEDAARVVYPIRLGYSGTDVARFALADGASESAFAKDWSNILVQAFVDRPLDLAHLDSENMEEWLVPCQEGWDRVIPWGRIPWHGEAKTRAGALATLLALTFFRQPGHSLDLYWQAISVGDSCLFMVREEELLLCFPLDDASQFNNSPDLLCSNPANNGRPGDKVQRTGGNCQSGDVIILASDALAAWFLKQQAAEEKPWETILNIQPAQWDSWVQARREAGAMRNDDTTLIIARIR